MIKHGVFFIAVVRLLNVRAQVSGQNVKRHSLSPRKTFATTNLMSKKLEYTNVLGRVPPRAVNNCLFHSTGVGWWQWELKERADTWVEMCPGPSPLNDKMRTDFFFYDLLTPLIKVKIECVKKNKKYNGKKCPKNKMS